MIVPSLLVWFFATFVFGQEQRPQVQPVTEGCLGCICEASSNCNRALGCRGGVCGPFGITTPYWIDAGKPTLVLDNANDKGAFSRCVSDPVCAGKTVTNYMNRFQRDCNNDGIVDCYDYAIIHRHGPYGCTGGSIDLIFNTQFQNCMQNISKDPSTTNDIDIDIRSQRLLNKNKL